MFRPDDLLTQTTLLRQLADPRNHAAWETFCRHYGQLIRRWCLQQGFREDEAEDLMQEILIKLVRAMSRGSYQREKGRFRPWLRTLVRNHLTDQRRRGVGAMATVNAGPSALAEWPDPASLDDLEEATDEVCRQLREADAVIQQVQNAVEPHTWEAFWRTAMLERPNNEVAAQLGMSCSAVSKAKHRVATMLHAEGKRVLSESVS